MGHSEEAMEDRSNKEVAPEAADFWIMDTFIMSWQQNMEQMSAVLLNSDERGE